MIGLTLFVGVVIANFNENKVKRVNFFQCSLCGGGKKVKLLKSFIFLGNRSSNSGSEKMGGSEESTENSTTSPSSSSPRYSHTHTHVSRSAGAFTPLRYHGDAGGGGFHSKAEWLKGGLVVKTFPNLIQQSSSFKCVFTHKSVQKNSFFLIFVWRVI